MVNIEFRFGRRTGLDTDFSVTHSSSSSQGDKSFSQSAARVGKSALRMLTYSLRLFAFVVAVVAVIAVVGVLFQWLGSAHDGSQAHGGTDGGFYNATRNGTATIGSAGSAYAVNGTNGTSSYAANDGN